MKILILVQACLKDPYLAMMKKQQETMDTVFDENITTVYYYGDHGSGMKKIKDNVYEYGANTSDEYEMMHWKLKLCMDEIIKEDWDFIFRTNASSYINKKELLKFAYMLPKEKCYCGIDGGNFASGCGFFMSRDCAEIFIKECDNGEIAAEDCHIGTILLNHGIEVTSGARRANYNYVEPHNTDLSHYHYRCKSERNNRTDELTAFAYLHKHIL